MKAEAAIADFVEEADVKAGNRNELRRSDDNGDGDDDEKVYLIDEFGTITVEAI